MVFSTLFLDLDDTLYPSDSGIWQAIRDRIGLYLIERLHIDQVEANALRMDLYHKYGTTLRGLKITREIDEFDYLNFVHDVPISKFLSAQPDLKFALDQIPLQKWIFTNADTNHAVRVLRALEIEDSIAGIIDVIKISPFCKPEVEAFHKALELSGNPDPCTCILVDDSLLNLETAKKLGFYTIWAGGSDQPDFVDSTISKIVNLPNAIPNMNR
jgi:pyrimidine 5'-nucleotidase